MGHFDPFLACFGRVLPTKRASKGVKRGQKGSKGGSLWDPPFDPGWGLSVKGPETGPLTPKGGQKGVKMGHFRGQKGSK